MYWAPTSKYSFDIYHYFAVSTVLRSFNLKISDYTIKLCCVPVNIKQSITLWLVPRIRCEVVHRGSHLFGGIAPQHKQNIIFGVKFKSKTGYCSYILATWECTDSANNWALISVCHRIDSNQINYKKVPIPAPNLYNKNCISMNCALMMK